MRQRFLMAAVSLALAACPPPDAPDTAGETDTDMVDTDVVDTDPVVESMRVPVLVTLDGAPVEGAKVVPGGA